MTRRVGQRTFKLASLFFALAMFVAACTQPGANAGTGSNSTPTVTSSSQSAAVQPAAGATTGTAAAAPSGGGAAASVGGNINISAILNITGPTASQGVLFRRAIDLAVNQVNAAGGVNGKKIAITYEDMQSTNPGALAAINRAIGQDNPLVLIGSVLSTQVQATSDADKAAGIPMATGGTAVKNTHLGNGWLFRMRPDDSVAASAMVKYIKETMKLTKIGVLHDADAFGTGGNDLVKQYAQQQGLTVVSSQAYTSGTKDFTSQMLALKNAGAEVMIVYATRPEDVALIETQYRQLGSPFQYLGSPSSAEVDTLALSKDAATGLHAVVDFALGQTDASKKYVDAYKKAYNSDPDALSAWNYDAVMLYADAIKNAGTDRAAIMKWILSQHNWVGVCGTYDFTPNGDGLHSNSVVEIQQGGQLKLIQVVTVAPTQQ